MAELKKPILCLDFDGVCHSYISGWKGIDEIPDPPVDGLFEFLNIAKEYFEIQVYSTRSSHSTGINAMRAWFSDHFTEYMFEKNPDLREKFQYFLCPEWIFFPEQKPPAFVSIDDRVLTFEGEWPEIEMLKSFKPWNKK